MKYTIIRVSQDNYSKFDAMVYWRINKREQEQIRMDWPKEIENTNLHVYAIEVEEKFVGWTSMIFIPKVGIVNRKGYVYVEELWIQESYRRKGYARLLMEKANEVAIHYDASGIRLGVNVENPNALDLYKKCGYHVTGQAYTMEKVK